MKVPEKAWPGDVYYSPDKWGLNVVGEFDSAAPWEFCKTVVWKDPEDGRYYYAQDSGCSCPTAFEAVASPGDLVPLENYETFRSAVDEHHEEYHEVYGKDEFLEKIKREVFAFN